MHKQHARVSGRRPRPLRTMSFREAKSVAKGVKEAIDYYRRFNRDRLRLLSESEQFPSSTRKLFSGRATRLIENSSELSSLNQYHFLKLLFEKLVRIKSGKIAPREAPKAIARLDSLFRLLSDDAESRETGLKIRFKPEHTFLDGMHFNNFLSVRVRGIGEVGLVELDEVLTDRGQNIYISAIQETEAESTNARTILGKKWYEAFIDKLIKCSKPLFGQKRTILLCVQSSVVKEEGDAKQSIYRGLRDRYFTSSVKEPGYSPLNPRRKRVRELLGEVADKIPEPERMLARQRF